MDIYLDTNIIISNFHIRDPLHTSATALLSQSTMTFVTGLITLIELESVLGRLWKTSQLVVDKSLEAMLTGFPVQYQIMAIVEYCILKSAVKVLPEMTLEKFSFCGDHFIVDNTFNLAYRLGPEFNLKTLDTLHVASAAKINHVGGFNIHYLVTNDVAILNDAKSIQARTSILPISCNDLCVMYKIPF